MSIKTTPLAKIISGYTGDPDTRDSRQLQATKDLTGMAIGTALYERPAGFVLVDEKEYDKLLDTQRWMCALEAAGLDNWDGCDYAKDILEEWDEE